MSYHNLTNEEIVFLYQVALSITHQYEEVHRQQVLHQRVPTQVGFISVDTPVPQELIDEMLKSKHYLFMKSVRDKLLPITELIQESEPELYNDVMSIFDDNKKE